MTDGSNNSENIRELSKGIPKENEKDENDNDNDGKY